MSPTVRHFFKFIYDFGKHKKVNNVVKVGAVEDNLQSFDTDYCGPFKMYLFLTLFEPMEGSVVAESSSKKLNVKLIGEMLKEIFNLNTRQNERILDAFILQHDIEFGGVEEDFSDNEMEEN